MKFEYSKDMCMFIPACGYGLRIAARGIKPFIEIQDKTPEMALDRVMAMAPSRMDIEIALRRDMGCSPLRREAAIYFMNPTNGQAQTISQWLNRCRLREYILISNCDNAIDQDSIFKGMDMIGDPGIRGIVFTFQPEPGDRRWSYVDQLGGRIRHIAEKNPISKDAVAGVYILNMFALKMALRETDVYLSETLARMDGLHSLQAKKYQGWNDLEQLNELERT